MEIDVSVEPVEVVGMSGSRGPRTKLSLIIDDHDGTIMTIKPLALYHAGIH